MKKVVCLFFLFLSLGAFGFPNVLILSFPVGSGHIVPSEGLKNLILEKYPDAVVRIENSTKFYPMHEKEEKLRIKGYLDAVKEGKIIAKSDYENFIKRDPSTLLLSNFDEREFIPYLKNNKIDIIVTTIYRDALGLAKLKSKGLIGAKLTWLVTDYMVLPYQDIPSLIDMTFVGDRFLESEYKRISGKDIPVMGAGIPLSVRKFKGEGAGKSIVKGQIIHIAVAGGGEGIGKFSNLAKEVIDYYGLGKGKGAKIKFHFFVGRNQEEYVKIKELEKDYPDLIEGNGSLSNLDFLKKISKMDYYMTKPGGASTTEASVMGLPMILLRPIGAPEYGNLLHFLKNKMVVDFESPEISNIKNFGERVDAAVKVFEKNVDKKAVKNWSDSYDPGKIVEWMAMQKREKLRIDAKRPDLEMVDNFWSLVRKSADATKLNSQYQRIFDEDLYKGFLQMMGNKKLQDKETVSEFCDKSRIYFSNSDRFKNAVFNVRPFYKNAKIGTADSVTKKSKINPSGLEIISEEKLNCYIASSVEMEKKLKLIHGQLKAILNFKKNERNQQSYEEICSYLNVLAVILKDIIYIANFSELKKLLVEELNLIQGKPDRPWYHYHKFKGYLKLFLGMVEFNEKKFRKAVPYLKDSILEDVDPDLGLDFLYKSLVSANMPLEENLPLGRFENPQDFFIFYLRAVLDKKRGDNKSMMDNFNKALEWNRRDPEIFFLMDGPNTMMKEWFDEHPYFFTRILYIFGEVESYFDLWMGKKTKRDPVKRIIDHVGDMEFFQKILYHSLYFESEIRLEYSKEGMFKRYPYLLTDKIKKLFEKRRIQNP